MYARVDNTILTDEIRTERKVIRYCIIKYKNTDLALRKMAEHFKAEREGTLQDKLTKIISATYLYGYKIQILFSDGKFKTFDYESLIYSSVQEAIYRKYRDIEEFKKFKIIFYDTEIAWGEDWEMDLPFDIIYYEDEI